jgi:peptidoglycan/LPS O-acetylase OafA/YrhL
MVLLLIAVRADRHEWLGNLLFFANLPPASLVHGGNHLWSLCVEMQFYAGIALLVAMTGQFGLYALPIISLTVTLYRIHTGAYIDIVTWFRIDEILAGCILALTYAGWLGNGVKLFFGKLNLYYLIPLLILSSHPKLGPLNYFRPYIAMLTIGNTLYTCPRSVRRILESDPMAYIANISYALYIIHGVLSTTWLGSGDVLIRYIKRPLLFAATFGLAHLSTFQFEQRCIALGKRLAGRHRRVEPRLQASETPPT